MQRRKVEREILSVHNNFRKVHNAPELSLDREMCKEAKEWAEKLATSDSLTHNPNTKDGESLYMACAPRGKTVKPWKSVVAW